jgi:hypothetical protein
MGRPSSVMMPAMPPPVIGKQPAAVRRSPPPPHAESGSLRRSVKARSLRSLYGLDRACSLPRGAGSGGGGGLGG